MTSKRYIDNPLDPGYVEEPESDSDGFPCDYAELINYPRGQDDDSMLDNSGYY